MRRCHRSWILLGALLLTAAACRPTIEDEFKPDHAEEPQFIPQAATVTRPATAVTQQTQATPVTPRPTRTVPPPPQPTPQPTSSIADWQQVGGETAGMTVGMPTDWVNLSGELDVATATNPLGLTVLLLADSERTGRSLLAGKALTHGAFGVGLIADESVSTTDPVSLLTYILEQTTAVTPLSQVHSITNDAGQPRGAAVDIIGDLLGFFSGGDESLHARLYLFLPQTTNSVPDNRTAALFLFSAPDNEWEQYTHISDLMAASITVHDTQAGYVLNNGTANVLGDITYAHGITGDLDEGIKDVWTFTIDDARYVTASLSPEDKELDLSLTIINPSGQTITQVDNGYAGDIEVAADMFLTENGRYVIEVSEFFNKPGRYILSLALDEEPRFSSVGQIKAGEGIQRELPANSQHTWTFNGDAGQLVSIVLTPNDNQMDPILNLYGPDGQRLVALDEGFSGDPELISGFELPVTGQYSIVVSSFAQIGGSYTLTFDEGGEGILNFYDAGDLAYGIVKSETLRPDEAHAWFFEGYAGDIVHIAVQPLDDTIDLDVWLFDPDIQRLDASDELSIGEAERIELTLPDDGQYLILVRDFFGAEGQYEISLSASSMEAPEFAGLVGYGETAVGTLTPEESVFWQFNGDQNDVIDIEVAPGGDMDDIVFLLQDPEGKTVLEIDEALAGQSEVLKGFTIMTDGLWRIVVKDFFGAEGSYSLTVKRTR